MRLLQSGGEANTGEDGIGCWAELVEGGGGERAAKGGRCRLGEDGWSVLEDGDNLGKAWKAAKGRIGSGTKMENRPSKTICA